MFVVRFLTKTRCIERLQARGKLHELASNHTASRVIQFCAKYGGPEERKAIVEEIRANIVDMSKSKYGRHLVKKLIAVATKEEVPGALTKRGCVDVGFLDLWLVTRD